MKNKMKRIARRFKTEVPKIYKYNPFFFAEICGIYKLGNR